MTNTAEIIEFNPNAITAFDEFTQQLAEFKKDNDKLKFDYSDKRGNKEARSHIHTLRGMKSLISTAHKDAKSKALEYGRVLDKGKNDLINEVETMIEVHHKPLREIEEKEVARIALIEAKIKTLSAYLDLDADCGSEIYQEHLSEIEGFALDDSLEEFKAQAAITKDRALADTKLLLEKALKHESEQAELERLRKESEERAQKDHEERIAREAAERAQQEAEAKAAQEQDKRKQAEKEAEAAREAEKNKAALDLETARREKAEAEERAAKAQQEAKENAEREQAEKIERENQEAIKRENNKKHHAKINNQAVAGFVKNGLSKDDAILAVTAIAKRQIPNISIGY